MEKGVSNVSELNVTNANSPISTLGAGVEYSGVYS
jgi:hypothetical protein